MNVEDQIDKLSESYISDLLGNQLIRLGFIYILLTQVVFLKDPYKLKENKIDFG